MDSDSRTESPIDQEPPPHSVEVFNMQLARAVASGQLLVQCGRFRGLPVFIPLLRPLFDMLLNMDDASAIPVHRDWSPVGLARPLPCCDNVEGEPPPVKLQENVHSQWYLRIGLGDTYIGARGGSLGARLTLPANCRTNDTKRRIVRDYMCTDVPRTFLYLLCRIHACTVETSGADLIELHDPSRRVGMAHYLSIQFRIEWQTILKRLEAHYNGIGVNLRTNKIQRVLSAAQPVGSDRENDRSAVFSITVVAPSKAGCAPAEKRRRSATVFGDLSNVTETVNSSPADLAPLAPSATTQLQSA